MIKLFYLTDNTVVTVSINAFDPQSEGRKRWLYTMLVNDTTVFSGHNFSTPNFWDSEQAIYNLLGFLTLKLGDTDDDYFANYTSEQLAWSQSSACEELSIIVDDYENK